MSRKKARTKIELIFHLINSTKESSDSRILTRFSLTYISNAGVL